MQIVQYTEDAESQFLCYLPLGPPLASRSVDVGLGFDGTRSSYCLTTRHRWLGPTSSDHAMTNVPQHWLPFRRTELGPVEAGQGPCATHLLLSSMEGMTSEGRGHGARLDVDHLGRGSSSRAMDCHNSQRHGSRLLICVLDYPSEEEDPMVEEDITTLADSDYFPNNVLKSSSTR